MQRVAPSTPRHDWTQKMRENSLSPISLRSRGRKRTSGFQNVHFVDKIQVALFVKFPNEEKSVIWWTCQELAEIKERTMAAARQGKCDDDENTSRGLEDLAGEQSVRRAKACSAVLEEQRQQKAKGVCNPNTLSMLYKVASRQSIKRAQKRGEEDEEEALRVRLSADVDARKSPKVLQRSWRGSFLGLWNSSRGGSLNLNESFNESNFKHQSSTRIEQFPSARITAETTWRRNRQRDISKEKKKSVKATATGRMRNNKLVEGSEKASRRKMFRRASNKTDSPIVKTNECTAFKRETLTL